MQNVCTRGKSRTFYVKKDIPHDVRPAFGGKAQVWRSLGTTNKIEAIAKAHPILAEIEAKIVAAREPQTAQPVPTQTPIATSGLLKRDQLLAAVETWRVETIGRAHDAFFNGAADTFEDFGLEDMAHSERLYRLQQRQWSEIEGFDQRMVEALVSRGLAVSLEHPALTHIRNDFGAAWHDVESFTRQFRRGEFDGWPEDGSEAPAASLRTPTSALRGAGGVAVSPSAPGAPLTLTELLERFITSKGPPDANAIRGYVRRLNEALDSPKVHEITSAQMDEFGVDLRRFPVIKRPALNKLPFRRVLDWQQRNPDAPVLSKKTQWKWFLAYKRLFDYAVSIDVIVSNPVATVMPKAKGGEKERLAYDANDIALIFSRPLFQGFDRAPTKAKAWGYRDQPGDTLVKDAQYWLPILGLWTGCRLEELAAAKAADIKHDVEGGWFLDLTERKLKTKQSQRRVPLHKTLIDLGFITYAQEQQRRPDAYLFPDLPHDPEGRLSSSRTFTKWWGLWCEANNGKTGKIASPDKTFHSFRHSFKRACRDEGVREEFHDLLTGHKGNSVGRGYGQGASLKALAREMAKVSYPTFPALP